MERAYLWLFGVYCVLALAFLIVTSNLSWLAGIPLAGWPAAILAYRYWKAKQRESTNL